MDISFYFVLSDFGQEPMKFEMTGFFKYIFQAVGKVGREINCDVSLIFRMAVYYFLFDNRRKNKLVISFKM